MTIAAVAIGAMVVGSVLGAAGQVASAEASANDQEAAAQQSDFAAEVQEENAVIQTAQAEEEAKRIRSDKQRRIGTARARYGASGVLTSGGSPLAAISDQAEESELDALTVKYQGQIQARDSKNQAILDRNNASRQRAGASNTRTAGVIGAGATLISGAGRAASTFSQLSSAQPRSK